MPTGSWRRTFNTPGHPQDNDVAAERLHIYCQLLSRQSFFGSSQFHILIAYKLDYMSVVHWAEDALEQYLATMAIINS